MGMEKRKRTWTSIDWKVKGSAQNWRCAACNCSLDETAELDHIKPLHEGGSNDRENAQLLCTPCHKRKSLREETERIARVREKIAKRQEKAGKAPPKTEADVLEGLLEPVGDFDFSLYVFVRG